MESSSFKDGEVVWVKWRSMWWPGEVYDRERVPDEVTSSLRKPVIAFVKFLQEDSFELVRSNNNISKYNNEQKMEHIKKGMDKYRSNATLMENFSASITKAEQMTGGNVQLLKTLETPVKANASLNLSITSSTTTATPVSAARKTLSASFSTPTSLTKKALGSPSYNSSVKVQNTSNTDANRSNDKRFTCTMCPFTTDRINLLMMHIKGHSLEIQSRVSSSSSSMIEIRRPVIAKPPPSRKLEVDDGIAEDVRKIKESMKEQQKLSTAQQSTSAGGRKPKNQVKAEKVIATPKAVKARTSKRSIKVAEESKLTPEPEVKKEEEEIDEAKSKLNEKLKKELLADWMEEDDLPEKEKNETPKEPLDDEKPKLTVEKCSPVVPIRNIPKKQRVSEIYVAQPETVDDEKVEVSKKSLGNPRVGGKRKINAITTEMSPTPMVQPPPPADDDDDKLLTATADLLNETEVPKSVAKNATVVAEEVDNVSQAPSTTFHKSNDIDKRNLPPKERNKRIFRASNQSLSEEQVPTSVAPTSMPSNDNHDSTTTETLLKVLAVNKNDRQELMLPHKKKQSSRLPLTITSTSVTATEVFKSQPSLEVVGGRGRKKRKSSSEVNKTVEEPQEPALKQQQSPLRESVVDSTIKESCEDNLTQQIRGHKRRLSPAHSSIDEKQQESKKFQKSSDTAIKPHRIITCDAGEAICITSKGTLTVARRDSLKTTQANSVQVTHQVIISEPIVTATTTTTSSSSVSKPLISLPQPIVKSALKIPKENVEELKKQGLLTFENNRTKLTPKGIQKFREYQRDEKALANFSPLASSSSTSIVSSTTSQATDDGRETSEPSFVDSQEVISEDEEKVVEVKELTEEVIKDISDIDKINKLNDDSIKNEEIDVQLKEKESDQNGSSEESTVKEEKEEKIETNTEKEVLQVEEKLNSTTDNDGDVIMKEPVVESEATNEVETKSAKDEVEPEAEIKKEEEISQQEKSTNEADIKSETEELTTEKPSENGSKESKEDDTTETNEDANTSSGAGLIALQAETFGGPPNCFYLCRQIEDRYEPVDNQILVLNAQNALVPYEGSEVAITPGIENSSGSENLSAYSQLSPNSNIIINTPNGQKVELSYMTILALQDSADENGIASVELAGEQFELNINGIVEAITAQHDSMENADLLSSAMLIDGTENSSALILTESAELPIDINHSATQVSETLSKPIMSTTVAPEISPSCPVKATVAEKNLNIDDSLASIGVTTTRANVPKSLELPITVTNPTIAETVNHRKLAVSGINPNDIVPESFAVVQDNGSDE